MKIIKGIVGAFQIAWHWSLTFYFFLKLSIGLLTFAENVLNNDIVGCVALGIVLIAATYWAEKITKDKTEDSESCPNRTTKLGRTQKGR